MTSNRPETRSQRFLAEDQRLQGLQEEDGDDTIVEQPDDNESVNSATQYQAQIDALQRELQEITIQLRRATRSSLQTPQIAPPTPVEGVIKNLQTPGVLRDLPCFDGNPVKLHQFFRSIESILPVLDPAKNSPIYGVWMQAIRSKIIGDADTVLELYGTELSWEDIKSTLLTHYNDKRDEVSLTRDLFKLSQTGTVEELYSKISHIISLMVNQLNLNERNDAVRSAKNKYYQEIGLKVFLAGLKEPLGPIIRAQAPKTLKEALGLCLEESNYNYVKNPFKVNVPSTGAIPKPTFPQNLTPRFPQQPHRYTPAPTLPPRQFPRQPFQAYPRPMHRPAYPQMQQQPNKFWNQSQNDVQKTTPPHNTPRVPPSVKINKVNYMNRPHFHEQQASADPYYDPYYYYYYPTPDAWYECDPAAYGSSYDNYEPTADSQSNSESEQPADEDANASSNVENTTSTVDDLNFRTADGYHPTT